MMNNMTKVKSNPNEKSQKVLKGVAKWCAFYRSNPQRFAKDYLHISLKLFQKFLIYAMMHNNHFMFWACRSQYNIANNKRFGG